MTGPTNPGRDKKGISQMAPNIPIDDAKVTVTITAEADRAIRGHAIRPFDDSNGTRLPDGSWSVQLDAEVYLRVKARQLKGETISDTIVRICAGRAH